MTRAPKILAFSGSARRESYNQKLVTAALVGAEREGAEVTLINLADYPMPIFNEDEEAESGMPEHAQRFKELLLSHDGFLIACPEYNSSITPLLKNAIDWASRRQEGEPRLAAYTGKVVGLLSASAGALGGLRGLVVVRSLFGNIHCMVLPNQFALSNAHEAFHEDGTLRDEKTRAQAESVASDLAKYTTKIIRE